MAKKPETNSLGNQELDKAEKQFEAYEQNIKDLTLDRMNQAPKLEIEPQTKIAQVDIAKSREIYLKPEKTIQSKEKFNEDYREEYNFAKEYVQFTAENKEIIGESIELWTKPFAGIPCELWKVPVNRPVWGPRYLAERLKACQYHRLTMQERPVSGDSMGQYYGHMVADNIVQRLDAIPVSSRKSIFMGAAGNF